MSRSRNGPGGGPGISGVPVGRHEIPQPPGRPGLPMQGGSVDLAAGQLTNRQPEPPGSPVPVGPNELLRAYEGGDEGPYVGRSAVGDREAPWAQTKRSFLSHFPGLDVKQWRRTVSITAAQAGTSGTAFPVRFAQPIEAVPRTQARIITGVRLEWIQRNYNPFGTAMPAGAPGYHDEMDNADGCVQFILQADGNALVDVREQVITFGTGGVGPATVRTINGWFKLHCNLLADAGEHPEALYVFENQQITGEWTTVARPNFQPDWLSVTLDGWSCSFETLRRVQQAAGMSF